MEDDGETSSVHVQQPNKLSDRNFSRATLLNETSLRNEIDGVNESNERCKIIGANDEVPSWEERAISGVSNITAADVNRQNGLASIAESYSGSDGETCIENSAVPFESKKFVIADESSKEIENNDSVGTHSISISEKDTSLEKQEGNTSLQILKNESEDSTVLEKNGHMPTEHLNVGHTVVEQVNVGHSVIKPLDARNIAVVSNTAQVYAMNNIDNELEIISKKEGASQRRRTEEDDSSSCESSSDSDDESSSSESSTSSSSSDDDLQDIRNKIEREEEKVQTGPPRTKSEVLVKDLPEVPDLDINIDDNVKLVELGLVFSTVESLVVVKALPQTPALDTDSILFLENRSCLGLVFETFGPVQTPFYSVRFNKETDISDKNVQVGDKVFYAPNIMEYSHYVFVAQLKKLKGSDASWEHDEEPPDEAIEYSDDEEEAKAKASKKKERMAKSCSADNNTRKMEETGETLHQGTNKGSRKRTWRNRGKGQPANQTQNKNQGIPHTNPAPPTHPAYRGPVPWQGSMFSPQAPGRPFMDHPTTEGLNFGMRPMVPPRGVPPSRLPLSGPPHRGPLGMVPGPERQFPVTHPVPMANPPRIPYELPRPLSQGPGFQGPWAVGPPSGFPPRHPLPPGFHDPGFQGQSFMGMPPPPPPPPNL